MARKPRFNLIGIPQHIIQRGNNREPCFYSVSDYQRYLHDLEDAVIKNKCAIHAYAQVRGQVFRRAHNERPDPKNFSMKDLTLKISKNLISRSCVVVTKSCKDHRCEFFFI